MLGAPGVLVPCAVFDSVAKGAPCPNVWTQELRHVTQSPVEKIVDIARNLGVSDSKVE